MSSGERAGCSTRSGRAISASATTSRTGPGPGSASSVASVRTETTSPRRSSISRASRSAQGRTTSTVAFGPNGPVSTRSIRRSSSYATDSGSTFFVLAGHGDPHDGAAPQTYEHLRPRLVETLLDTEAEIGLHGSYATADDTGRLAEEKATLEALAGPVHGQRYHYLRADPHRNLTPLAGLGFRYDTTLGFPDAVGFRAGIAHPFRPWNFERDEPLDLVEIPLAAMDATLAEERYLGLAARRAEPRLMRLLDWAAEHGGAFAILWHPDRFDPATSAGWDRLYSRLLDGVRRRGGICMSAAELASSHSTWSK